MNLWRKKELLKAFESMSDMWILIEIIIVHYMESQLPLPLVPPYADVNQAVSFYYIDVKVKPCAQWCGHNF